MKLRSECPIHPCIGVRCWHVEWEPGDPQHLVGGDGATLFGHTCFMTLEQFTEGTHGARRETMAEEMLRFLRECHTYFDSGIGDPYEFSPHPVNKPRFIRRKVFADGSALVWNDLPRRQGGQWEVEQLIDRTMDIPGFRDGERVYREVTHD